MGEADGESVHSDSLILLLPPKSCVESRPSGGQAPPNLNAEYDPTSGVRQDSFTYRQQIRCHDSTHVRSLSLSFGRNPSLP